MKRSYWLLPAALVLVVLAGCPPTAVMHVERGPIPNNREMLPFPTNTCMGLTCDQMFNVNNCGLEDEDGHAVTSLTLNNGERICFKNVSNCEITIKYSTDLFARSQPFVTLGQDDCTNLTVTSDATGRYTLELICDCGTMGAGHSNPDVIIGGDD